MTNRLQAGGVPMRACRNVSEYSNTGGTTVQSQHECAQEN